MTDPPSPPPEDDLEMLQTLDKSDQHTLDGASGGKRPTADLGLAAGGTLGAYRLERLLGRGGFGEVWEAEDASSGRRVAVKVLTQSHASALDRERFRREGRLAASISHPNCVYVFAADDVDGRPTIVMELVPGGTLQDVLEKSGPFPVARAVDCALDVLEGLDAAFRGGVIHRDVKPSNCFLDESGRVKIGDFGLSRTAEVDTRLTATGVFAGTPAYSSPEQVKAADVDFRSDVYSLGATLYSLLTGKTPFEGTQLGAVLSRILTEPPPPLAAHGVKAPAGLEKVVLRMMAKDPARRFPSWAAARAALVPYSSHGLGPASVARRVAASLLDSIVMTPVALVLLTRTANPLWPTLVGFTYYVLLEKLWGKSLGKRAFRLEVTTASGGDPSWGQILLRTLVFSASALAASLLGGAYSWRAGTITISLELARMVSALWYAVLASTMRRANGYAGLHEVLSGTRVRSLAEGDDRERPQDDGLGTLLAVDVARLGPYDVRGAVWSREGESLLAGRDPVLGRDVLIHRFAGPARPPAAIPGTLRWLQSGPGWQAYERPGGASLWSWVHARGPRSYAEARLLLTGLLESLPAPGALSALSLAHVWVDPLGRARRLDFAAVEIPAEEHPGTFDAAQWPLFLKQVLLFVLEGTVVRTDALGAKRLSVPVPAHARAALAPVVAGTGTVPPEALLASLRETTARASAVRPAQRAAALALPTFAVFISCLAVGMTLAGVPMIETLAELQRALRAWQKVAFEQPDPAKVEAAERRVSHAYARAERAARAAPAPLRGVPKLEETLGRLTSEERRAFEQARARHPPGPRDLTAPPATTGRGRALGPRIAGTLIAFFFTSVTGAALVSALLTRGGAGLRFAGITVQRRNGADASRARCLWRAAVAWAPAGVLSALGFVASTVPVLSVPVLAVSTAAAVALLAAGAAYALRRPSRGLQDRLAGTILMPR